MIRRKSALTAYERYCTGCREQRLLVISAGLCERCTIDRDRRAVAADLAAAAMEPRTVTGNCLPSS